MVEYVAPCLSGHRFKTSLLQRSGSIVWQYVEQLLVYNAECITSAVFDLHACWHNHWDVGLVIYIIDYTNYTHQVSD